MALVTKNDVTQIFAIQAPSIDLPPTFANYPRGWDAARSNNGKPTIKQFNYIQQRTDQNVLWIHQNGAALPYDAAMEYAEGAVVVKDGELQKKQGASWVFAANKGYNLDYFVSGKSYPLHAEIMLTNGDIVKSTIPNNTNNPNVDMTGWVLDSTTVENIGELLLIQSPKNNKTVFVKSRNNNTLKGGGYFNFVAGSTKNDGGQFFATATGSWHRITLESWKNIQWWGAVGDGVTDDITSILDAIRSFGNIDTWTGESNPPISAFCTLYVPPSEGNYIISSTIYLLPQMVLRGDSPYGNYVADGNKKYASTIEPKFAAGNHSKWAITTLNRVRATGVLTAWDSVYGGNAYDSGVVTGCFGTKVFDLILDNKSFATARIYGGIRLQNSPECAVERCYIKNFDVCLATCGSWNAKINVNTEYFKCGVFAWGDMNNLDLSGYQQRVKTTLPMVNQMEILKTNDGTSGLSFDMSTQTYGAYIAYAYGFSIANLITEHSDCGILITQSKGYIGSLYAEKNTRSIAAIASQFSILALAGVSNDNGFNLGSGSDIRLDAMVADHTVNIIEAASIYYSHLTVVRAIEVPYHPNISIVGGRDVIYLDNTSGNDNNSGLYSYRAVKTLTKALTLANNESVDTLQSNSRPLVRQTKTIVIMDSSNYTLSDWAVIKNADLFFTNFNSNIPKITVGEKNFNIYDCTVTMTGVNVERLNQNTFLESQGYFICFGKCEIKIESPQVNLAYPLISVSPGKSADVKLSICGGTGVMGVAGKYVETFSGSTKFDVFVRLNNTGTNINASADNGVTVPGTSWVQKSVSAVV